MAFSIRQYSWAINLVGILFCSYFLANITGVYIGKSMEVKRSVGMLAKTDIADVEKEVLGEDAYGVIVERDIFDPSERATKQEGEGSEEEVVEEEGQETGEAVPTSLSLTVLGVLVVGEGTDSRSSATISSGGGGGGGKGGKGGGSAAVYAVGDKESFAPNTKLTRVQPSRIEFLNGGRLEYAEVGSDFGTSIFGPPSEGAVTASAGEAAPAGGDEGESLIKAETPGKYTVDRREIDNALQNLDQLYTEIRAVPHFSGGKVAGMKILSVKSGSLFAKLGLQRGDILQRINGMELDVKKGFEIFSKLKDENDINLDVMRKGQPTTLEYEIR